MENKSVFKEIILNNSEFYDTVKNTKEYERLFDKIVELIKRLKSTLNKEQNELLEVLNFTYAELGAETADNYYVKGLKIGVRLAAECFLC